MKILTATQVVPKPPFFLVLALGYLSMCIAPQSLYAASKATFEHKAPTKLPAGKTYILRGKITENDDLEEVSLRIRRKGEINFRNLPMTIYEGNRYRVKIEGKILKGTTVEYYVEGIDLNQKQRFLFASDKKPHVVVILDKNGKAPVQVNPTPPDKAPKTEEEETKQEDTVTGASRREQRIQQAPAVVTVITAADIKRAGWRTLLELLRYVVGIDINNNGHWPDIGIRGVNPRTSYGDKLIILVDGHNMSSRQFNRNYLNASWIGIDSIKRVEIIRGPGSSLWGANALNGVINIITKTGQDLKGLEGTIGGAPLTKSYFLNLQGGQEIVNGLSFRASFSIHKENRSPRLAPILEFNIKKKDLVYVPSADSTYSQNFYAQLQYKSFKLTFHQSRYDPQAPLSTFSRVGGDDSRFVTDRTIIKLSWGAPLQTWGSVLAWASFDHWEFAPGTVYESNAFNPAKRTLIKMAAQDNRLELGTQLNVLLIDKENLQLSTSVGLDFEYLDMLRWHFPERWEQAKLPTPLFSTFHLGSFLQVQATIAKWIELTLGGRFDYDQQYGTVLTPRAALVFTPALGGIYGKLLYGRAFKPPSTHDLYYFRKDALYGNPLLRPESVHTMEAQVGWTRSQLMTVSLNGYISMFNNLIAYTQQAEDTPLEGKEVFPSGQAPGKGVAYRQKKNLPELTTYGGEFEFRLFPIRSFQVSGSFGLFMGSTSDGQPLPYTAGWTASLIASYQVNLSSFKLLVSLGGQVTGPKPVPALGFDLGTGNTLPTQDAPPNAGSDNKPWVPPSWASNQDPTTMTPLAVRSFATIQFLDIMKRLDIIVRVTNLANQHIYDASNLLLYPQKKLDIMTWLRVRY